jgi:hypothetical protein
MGFEIGFWDYATFAALFVLGCLFIWAFVIILGLPGRIAIARHHPDAEAVNLMGWLGFAAVVPWVQAFIWAFKPTNKVDIRYMPQQVAEETEREITKLTGGKVPTEGAEPINPPPPHA